MTTLQGRYDLCFRRPSRDSRDQLGSKLDPSYEAEAERKGLDPDRANSTKSWSRASGKKRRSRPGFVIGSVAPSANAGTAGIVSKAVQQSSAVVGIYVILDQ